MKKIIILLFALIPAFTFGNYNINSGSSYDYISDRDIQSELDFLENILKQRKICLGVSEMGYEKEILDKTKKLFDEKHDEILQRYSHSSDFEEVSRQISRNREVILDSVETRFNSSLVNFCEFIVSKNSENSNSSGNLEIINNSNLENSVEKYEKEIEIILEKLENILEKYSSAQKIEIIEKLNSALEKIILSNNYPNQNELFRNLKIELKSFSESL